MDSHSVAPLDPAGVRRFRVAVALAFFVNGAAFATWVSRIPALRAGLGMDDGTLGAVLLALAAGVLCSFALTPRGVRLMGARRLVLLAGAAELLLLPAPFLVHAPASLALVLFEFGLANGAMDVSMNVLAVDAQERARKPIMSGLHGLWSLGGMAGATVGSLAARDGVAPLAHLAAVAAVLAAGLAVSGRLDPRGGGAGVGHGEPAAEVEGRRPLRLDIVLGGLGIVCFCSFLVEGAMADWSGVLLRTRMQASESYAALGYAVFAGAMMVTRFLGDRLVARWGLRVAAILSASAAAAIVLGLAWARPDACLAAFMLAGLGLATVVPTCFSAAARHASGRDGARGGDEATATAAIAWVSGFGYVGMLLGPPLIGGLAQAFTLQVAFGLLALLLLVVALLGPALTRSRLAESSRATLEPVQA